MGWWWDWWTGRHARRASQRILRRKFPHVRGVSRATYEAMAAGQVRPDDDSPQLDKIIAPRDGE
jgi:hypothetical protein